LLCQPILQQDSEHFEALFTYGLYTRDDNQPDESCKVFLKMLMQQPDNQIVREQLSLSMRDPVGFEFIREQFKLIPTPSTALGFLSVVIKDWGGTNRNFAPSLFDSLTN